MGRKHAWQGKYFFLYTACLMILVISGCATVQGILDREVAREHLRRGKVYLSIRDFSKSLRESEQALSLAGSQSPGDEAVFLTALVHAYNDNPERNYKKALGYFQQLVDEYPESKLVDEAGVWIGVLKDIETIKKTEEPVCEKVNNKAEEPRILPGQKYLSSGNFQEAVKEYRKVLSSPESKQLADEALFGMGLLYSHYENPDKDYQEASRYFDRLIREYPKSPLVVQARIWQSVLNVIEEAKKVDIEIEKRKKELIK